MATPSNVNSQVTSPTYITVDTKQAGPLSCEVIGNLDKANTVLVTVHDLGCNSTSWHQFINQSCMTEITARAAWVNVNLPGQQEGAEDLPTDYKYPSMDDLAEALVDVLELSHAPVIGIGEGAGANIMARLALLSPKKLYGTVLIHCTSTTAGYLESMKDKSINWRLLGGMNPTAENYLIMHRFGDFSHAKDAEQLKGVIAEYHTQLAERMNAKNIRGFIDTFMHRSNIADKMGSLIVPMLMITGKKANHNHTTHTFYNATLNHVKDRKLVEFIELDDIANVVEGAPEKMAESLLFFCQGRGVLGGATMPHVNRKTTTKTMQEMDKSDI